MTRYKKIDISQLGEQSRKGMVGAILTQRDKVNATARADIRSAISDWGGVAPRKTGALASSVGFSANKSTALAVVSSDRFKLVNILNYNKTRVRKTAGFYTKWRNAHGQAFLKKY